MEEGSDGEGDVLEQSIMTHTFENATAKPITLYINFKL